MKRLYIGSFFEENRVSEIWANSKKGIVISGDKFQKSLLNGFRNINTKIDYILNVPAIGSFPLRYKKIYFKSSKFQFISNGVNLGFLNITVLKNISIHISIKNELKKWVRSHNDKKVILVYSIIEPYIKAAVSIKKRNPDIKISCIVLDLPEFFEDKNSLLYKLYSKNINKSIYNSLESVDSFILLTEAMAEYLNIKDSKPWMVIEGLYEPKEKVVRKKNKKTILYTGKLDSRFGIQDLLDSFNLIINDDYHLWICGEGSARNIVEDAVRKNSRIKYFGLLKPDEITELQSKATILINPRKGNDIYTKYSFPSKTMEYMASGTPTIMYPLEGVPNEYKQYLILVPDNTNETLKNLIMEWCEKSQEELDSFGEKSRQFILKNKTSEIQSKKIIDFLDKQAHE